MNFKINDLVTLKRKNLYWVLQGSHTLNAVVDSTSAEAEGILRARVLDIESAPRWGDILILAVEGEVPPKDTALVALCRCCSRLE